MSTPERDAELRAVVDEIRHLRASANQFRIGAEVERARLERNRALYQEKRAQLVEMDGHMKYRAAARSGVLPTQGSWGPGSDEELQQRFETVVGELMALGLELSFKTLDLEEAARQVDGMSAAVDRLDQVTRGVDGRH